MRDFSAARGSRSTRGALRYTRLNFHFKYDIFLSISAFSLRQYLQSRLSYTTSVYLLELVHLYLSSGESGRIYSISISRATCISSDATDHQAIFTIVYIANILSRDPIVNIA